MRSRLFYSNCDGDNCVNSSAAGDKPPYHGPKAPRWKHQRVANDSCVLLAETCAFQDIWGHVSSLVAWPCQAFEPEFGDVFTGIEKDFQQAQLAD